VHGIINVKFLFQPSLQDFFVKVRRRTSGRSVGIGWLLYDAIQIEYSHLQLEKRLSRQFHYYRQSRMLHCRLKLNHTGQSMWDFWWIKWHWDRSFSEYFGFPLWISFNLCSIIRKKKTKKINFLHHRVAQYASRLRFVRSICCRALQHKTKINHCHLT
jgi:hypothetical protein